MVEDVPNQPLPFKNTDTQIASSRTKNVLGYHDEEDLIKVEKPRFQKKYSSENEVIDAAKKLRIDRELIKEEIINANGGRDVVTPAYPVVHEGYERGSFVITEAQKEISNASTLHKVGKDVLNQSSKTLKDIKAVFAANINLHKRTGDVLDIVGSTNKKRSVPDLFLRNVLPLMYSENIIIDQHGNVHLVDVGLFTKNVQKNKMNYILTRLQLLGSHLSIFLLDRAIKKRSGVSVHHAGILKGST